MNISEAIESGTTILQAAEIAEAGRETKSLLAFVLDKNLTFLIAHAEYRLTAEEETRFREFVRRRAGREPFQYIVGRQEFCALDFAVTKDVLIPRPETEMLVAAAIDSLQEKDASKFCEIGVGSGCIAVSILRRVKTARAVGLDTSEKALRIAAQNAETHRVANRLELKISDVYANLENEKFDLIVSNPPYIPGADLENLQPEVRDFEPRTALTDGGDGLSIIKRIIGGAPLFLKPNGFLLIEIGINQADEVKKEFDKNKRFEVEILPDFQNIPRMVKAWRK